MEKFTNLSKTVMDRSKVIYFPDTCTSTTDEYNELRSITFTKSRPEIDALEGMFKALEIMEVMDLKKLPK